jgi:hypothetical protein
MKMRSTCNFIIFVACLADLLHIQGHWAFLYYIITGVEIPQETCFRINVVQVAGLFFCSPLMLMVAVDRLIAVTFPMK